ncbi:tripartite tricarboxylate transporter substrate binding protein [Orrella sp. JC864]|uniref:Bug family tripartite tricarboxylate transporter substrate binding protein n=1 Tax=Orrella sp. JC864 TaxID=3120298 RepID=UPI00300AC07A
MSLRSGKAVLAAAALCIAGVAQAQADWPQRPVTLIVIAGAGGGSDYTMRMLARELEAVSGQRFTIVNQAQGGGVVGMTNYVRARPDGYTLGQLSPYAQYTLLGQADFTADSYTPIGQFNADPAAIHVASGSRFKDVPALVSALKADPSSVRISCGGTCNASWDIPFASMLMDQGVDVSQVTFVPAQGSAAGLQELVSGGLDVVLASVPETDALTRAGHVKTIGVLAHERLDRYPDVPTVAEQLGKVYAGGTWRALAGPAGMEPALLARIEGLLKQAYDSEGFQQALRSRGFEPVWLGSHELREFMVRHEEQVAQVLKALRRTP